MKILKQVIVISLISFSCTSASSIDNAYSKMSTTELQKKVELLSKSGELPFLMGLELINRWTHKA